MRSKMFAVVTADIDVAKGMIYSDTTELDRGRNPYHFNTVAYHSAQCIEKLLKELLRDYGEPVPMNHNVSDMIVTVETYRPSFMQQFPLIASNANQISHFGCVRYGDKYVEKQDAFLLYKAAKELYTTLLGEHLKERGMNIKEMFQEAAEEMQNDSKAYIRHAPIRMDTKSQEAIRKNERSTRAGQKYERN